MVWDHCDRHPARPLLGLALLLVWVGSAAPLAAQSQATWEYAPYAIRVWLAFEPAPELTGQLQQDILATLPTDLRLAAGATWRVTAEPAPAALRNRIASAPASVTVAEVGQAVPDAFASDKIMALGVRVRHGDFLVSCRELDGETRTIGPIVERTAWQSAHVPLLASRAVVDAFQARVRIEQSRGKGATARVRAGGLVHQEECPSAIHSGDVLQPMIRRNDRQGEPTPTGIQVLEWTYLIARQQEGHLLECEVYSSLRNPLAGRSSARIQRMALKVPNRPAPAKLTLLSREEPPRPLEGYELFVKKPLADNGDTKNRAERLGLTNWQGVITIPPDPEHLLRIAYIKNGDHLIARLPIVPGFDRNVVMPLVSDDKRLEAEAFVKGLESMVMDLVARRAILRARIHRRLKEGRLQEAQELLTQIKSFRTKEDLEILIAGRQKAGLRSTNEREQQRIDYMLSGTRILLTTYLDPDQLVALQREVEQGAVNPPPTAEAAAKEAPKETPAAETTAEP